MPPDVTSNETDPAVPLPEAKPREAEVRAADLEREDAQPGGERREEAIRKAAFEAHVRRGSVAGHELDDWLEAERQFDEREKSAPPDT